MSESAMLDRASVSSAGMRIVRLLVGTPPQTVAELTEAVGVSRTAVTDQLNELIESGYAEKTIERLPGRGRPRYRFKVTDAALMLLVASHQQMLVPAIWKAIREVCGQKTINQLVSHVSRSLAEQYRGRITARKPEERLRQMSALLEEEGVLLQAEMTGDGGLVVHKRSCPFVNMYEESGAVCRVDLEMMKAVVGADVVRTACRHDGAPCCSFALAPTNGRRR